MLDNSPFSDVLPLELCVLICINIKLSVLHEELWVRGHVLGLPLLLPLHLLVLIGLRLSHTTLLLELEGLESLGH